MRITLRETARTQALVSLEAALPSSHGDVVLSYATRTGALVRVDGVTVGAFDREHDALRVGACDRERTLELTVERESLPTNHLPSGDGLRWKALVRGAHEEPSLVVDVSSSNEAEALPLWGHAHLDVAWLWDYTQARRKAARTFANAIALMDRDPSFVFVQSQPQLYAFVERDDPSLFERVRERVREGRFDASVAALWVESDANLPSGESLLRQMLAAHRYCVDRFRVEPEIAWLPDTFGFARTLPTLLAHAGIVRFAATKLQWNDTTRFPHAQFVWRGPDGSEVVAAMMASYDGPLASRRVRAARARQEPLIVGYGDGGGGPTLADLRAASDVGFWERPVRWFERLEAERDRLPVHDDELYLEYHRGTYTTHHDVKAANAALERALTVVEEQLAWCVAVRAPREGVDRLCAQLRDAWERVLCNQFHDVLPGTCVRDAFVEVMDEYERASDLLADIHAASAAMLPRASAGRPDPELVAPQADGDEVTFDNGIVHARVAANGKLVELRTREGRNVVTQANLLALYRDKPRKWDAWNLDAGYERRRERIVPANGSIVMDGFEIPYALGKASAATMRVYLRAGEPFLRVELVVDWKAEHRILRLENWLPIASDTVTYGAPHGSVTRSARRDTPEQRARFEVPGQRFADVSHAEAGLALLTLDTYGWSARALRGGGVQVGNSLLRSPRWPDPQSESERVELTWAFMPHAGAAVGTIERAWEQFAAEPRVRLFVCDDPAVVVVACKPADDGDGVIVRLRECDGAARTVRVRCSARARQVSACDAIERPIEGDVVVEAEDLVATIPAYGLRSFRVRF
jgi:alpha-mannosidase